MENKLSPIVMRDRIKDEKQQTDYNKSLSDYQDV